MLLKDFVSERWPKKTAALHAFRLATSLERRDKSPNSLPDHVFAADFTDGSVEYVIAETDEETRALKDLVVLGKTSEPGVFGQKTEAPKGAPGR